jgi:ribosomal protein S18 acetylase RimI-like enzyme
VSEITIRAATVGDVDEIDRLVVEVYVDDGFVAAGDSYAAKLADARSRLREAELLVAVDPEDTIVGTVTIAPPGSPWVNVATPDELEFRMLAVSSAARGQGVGEALVRTVLDRAVELGLRAVMLSSQTEMVAAHRLYERMGFHRTPDRDWTPEGTAIVLITYRLDLKPGSDPR